MGYTTTLGAAIDAMSVWLGDLPEQLGAEQVQQLAQTFGAVQGVRLNAGRAAERPTPNAGKPENPKKKARTRG